VWTNDFDADGGQLYFGDDPANPAEGPITYTIPADPDNPDLPSATQIDLVGATLANPYTDGTSVWVFPKMVERWCWFMPPDGEEPIVARVPHQLVPLLPLGQRDADTAEQIEVGESGTDLVVSDVLARPAVQDLGSVLITTDPSQSGERVDIDQDGIREIEADGTTVAVSLTQGEGLDLLADSAPGASVARILRWLLADGTRIVALSGYETPTLDATLLAAYAKDASHTAGASLLALDHLGVEAGIRVLNDHGFNATTFVGAGAAGDKLLFDASGGSDYLFADGSNLPTGLLGTTAWADWTPTLSGWSANPTNAVYRYKRIGKMVVASIRQATNGTSNATTKSITAPVAAATIPNMVWAEACSATDNGSALATSSGASIASGSSTINFSKDLSTTTGGWTASGGHKIQTCTLIYEAA
jgi:hypothetical protein